MMDVISGAMGAFLIIMVVLARYYKSDPAVSQSVEELGAQIQHAVEKLDRAEQDLGAGLTNNIPDLRKLLEEARFSLEDAEHRLLDLKEKLGQAASQIERLNKAVQELKGEVARFESENAQLLSNNKALMSEIQKLRTQARTLQGQVTQAQRERDEALKLAREQTQTFQEQVSQTQRERDDALQRATVAEVRRPFVMTLAWEKCYGADIDLYARDLTTKDKDGKFQEPFSPFKKQNIFWPGDTYLDISGTAQSQFGFEIWSVRDALKNSSFAIYYKLTGFNNEVTQQDQQCLVHGYYMYNGQISELTAFNLTTKTPYAVAGFLTMSNEGKLEYRAPTGADQKALRDYVATLQPK